jgi:hypothetical protein
MYEHAAKLAAAGDLAGARAMSEAAVRLLSDEGTTSKVIDIATRKRER